MIEKSKLNCGGPRNLTIVIPTYNRSEYIKRSIRFWNGKEVNVLILDGSKNSILEFEDVIIPENITYIHSETSLANRLNMTREIVNTKYSVLLGDDEFFIPSTLELAVRFLDSHPDYIACGGQCIGFLRIDTGQVRYRLRYPEFKNFDLDESDASQRVISHFENYTPAHIYSVMRTEVWKSAIWPGTQFDFAAYGAAELAFEFIASSLGKCKMLPLLYWFRSRENGPSLSSEKSTNPKYKFEIWWNDKKYELERNKFRSLVLGSIVPDDEKHNREEIFDLAFKGYYLNTARPQVIYHPRRLLSKIKLFRLINQTIFKITKDLIHRNHINSYFKDDDILELLEQKEIYVDKACFNEITKIVRDFHASRFQFYGFESR